jgi:CheY-like chemotaxis protein
MTYRQKLLVIEPDADTAQLLDESLSAQGYDVRLTDSAGGAMLLLRYYEPDAVLLAQAGEEDRSLPRVAPMPSDENWSLATLCRLWKIPIIYMLETPDSPCKQVKDDNFFR